MFWDLLYNCFISLNITVEFGIVIPPYLYNNCVIPNNLKFFFNIPDTLFKSIFHSGNNFSNALSSIKNTLNESPLYLIGNSCFSTLTLNYNWRTACHYDDGDFNNGLSIISVLGDNKWEGCMIGFPKYKIAVDVRVGDIIIMDSHEMHCNTEFKYPPDNNGNANYNRLSIVLYLREHMNQCKDIPNGINKIEKFLT